MTKDSVLVAQRARVPLARQREDAIAASRAKHNLEEEQHDNMVFWRGVMVWTAKILDELRLGAYLLEDKKERAALINTTDVDVVRTATTTAHKSSEPNAAANILLAIYNSLRGTLHRLVAGLVAGTYSLIDLLFDKDDNAPTIAPELRRDDAKGQPTRREFSDAAVKLLLVGPELDESLLEEDEMARLVTEDKEARLGQFFDEMGVDTDRMNAQRKTPNFKATVDQAKAASRRQCDVFCNNQYRAEAERQRMHRRAETTTELLLLLFLSRMGPKPVAAPTRFLDAVPGMVFGMESVRRGRQRLEDARRVLVSQLAQIAPVVGPNQTEPSVAEMIQGSLAEVYATHAQTRLPRPFNTRPSLRNPFGI